MIRLLLDQVLVQPIQTSEESRFQALMQSHHYLGSLPKIGNTLWYVASWEGKWLSATEFFGSGAKVRRP